VLGSRAVELIVTNLAADSPVTEASLSVLSADERARADRLALDVGRRRYITARARLRYLLAARLNARPQDLRFVTGRHGKPALGGVHAGRGLEFNVAHCADVAVFAFSWAGPVGVDIETVRPVAAADEIVTALFSRRENSDYRALGKRERLRGFFNCWTRKEAFVKALGSGLTFPLKRFDVTLTPGEPARILRVDDTPGAQCGWRVRHFAPSAGLVGAVVTRWERAGRPLYRRHLQ